jgi:hypothetical protein
MMALFGEPADNEATMPTKTKQAKQAKQVRRMFAERKNDLSSLARFFIGKLGFEFLIENKTHLDCKILETLTTRAVPPVSDQLASYLSGKNFKLELLSVDPLNMLNSAEAFNLVTREARSRVPFTIDVERAEQIRRDIVREIEGEPDIYSEV